MGQKTHPLGFRLGITQTYKSSWFSNMKSYPKLAQEDYKIRKLIKQKLHQASIALIHIDRKVDQIQIHIHTARPGIILGKMGHGLNDISKNLETILNNNIQIRIKLVEITDPDKEATLIAEFIVQQLEKRIAFRRVIRQAIQKSQKAKNQGIKIQISGRLNGAEIARSEWIREGRVPLQTLRAHIDYSYKTAHTIYGILGVKVWLFKGEKIITDDTETINYS
uniref:Small ribosomal subunit protein uS3c n=1 Tax=Hydropuntia rangiferina TaxID=338881 RepID=A0A345U8I2_9FLOR|nr:ribosomal protein S3 [Hydropuntia rangiferina]AXI96768.1 ribosomal protein S3 [Hydropuntia rangiferina]UAD87449.1 ribosomal protein S3 [Hydropuntia rangiferina]